MVHCQSFNRGKFKYQTQSYKKTKSMVLSGGIEPSCCFLLYGSKLRKREVRRRIKLLKFSTGDLFSHVSS